MPLSVRWATQPTLRIRENGPTYFEQQVQRLGLSGQSFLALLSSPPLICWIEKHRTQYYVPEELLRMLGRELYESEVQVA